MVLDQQVVDRAQEAAERLACHPQDHGWRKLYAAISESLRHRTPSSVAIIEWLATERPRDSWTHLITLVGIGIKHAHDEALSYIVGPASGDEAMTALDTVLVTYLESIKKSIQHRCNSFTGTRRFLVPQVILGAYFNARSTPCRIADIGTGIGILPRQLNRPDMYHRLAADLVWSRGIPTFRNIPLTKRVGIDRGPFPDMEWVKYCYGPSVYYEALFSELADHWAEASRGGAEVELLELDITDEVELRNALQEHDINAANISYVLYEMSPTTRNRVLNCVRSALRFPGLLITTEPSPWLSQSGCKVHVYDQDGLDGLEVCNVSDGHFRGTVSEGTGFGDFVAQYNIEFQREE